VPPGPGRRYAVHFRPPGPGVTPLAPPLARTLGLIKNGVGLPQNKNHHFVPQFYLRFFSQNGRSIGAYSLADRHVVESASIRGQCQRGYFYGRDGTAETAFSTAEGASAKVLKDIAATQRPPRPQGDNHIVLMFHVVSQHARTASMASEQIEFDDAFAKSLLRPTLPRDGLTVADLDRVTITTESPVSEAMHLIIPMFPLTLDLRCIVLMNATKTPLITSDNPVVLYNQLLEERSYVSNTGLQSVGLQIYLPLGPDAGLFFYDKDVYGVGPKNPTRVVLTNPYDIEQLNGLQVVNAEKNLYFDSSQDFRQLAHLHAKYQPHRRKRRANFINQREMPIKRDESRELIAFFREDVRCKFTPTFLKTLKRAKLARTKLMGGTFVRDPKVCDKHDQFQDLIRLGKRQPSDLLKFLRDEA
jgi:hypothetical protein